MEKIERIQVNSIRVGSYILLDDVVVRVVETHTAKPGKHGSAKMLINAVEVITGKQKSGFCHTGGMIDVPVIDRKEYQLLDVNDNFLSLLDHNGNTRDDITIESNEIGDKIRSMFEKSEETRYIMVQVMHFMDVDLVVDAKFSNKN